MYEFEFDERKSRADFKKHGIDFMEAQALWADENVVEIPAKIEGELRVMVIGQIGGKFWSAIITPRDRKIRIISVRRSRTEEVEIYES
jgi:uncharacterized DUF497 family protein